MSQVEAITIDKKEVTKYFSDYLLNGRKSEIWSIESVQIDSDILISKVRMDSIYLSRTDENQFHLTIFTALEFMSQLMIIYGHVWAGLKCKSQEGWMVDSQIRAVRAIRNPNNIEVNMKISKISKRGTRGICIATYTIFDDNGGLFEGGLKGFLS